MMKLLLLISLITLPIVCVASNTDTEASEHHFPVDIESYNDADLNSIPLILKNRIKKEPFNLVATIIFLLAIIHTFLTSKFTAISHHWRELHSKKIKERIAKPDSVDVKAEILHFLGEVEVVFGLWLIPLIISIVIFHSWEDSIHYMHNNVNLTEAAFVVVIMVLAATRPVLQLAEKLLTGIANLMGGTLNMLWLTILTIGPLLGSFVTEPAAMTISAILLSRNFYSLEPSNRFKYATLALLFVNVSVGGALTNFAAPPVLMVAGPWGWTASFMFTHFGWKVIIGIIISNLIYFWMFRSEFGKMQHKYDVRKIKDEIEKKYITKDAMDEAWYSVIESSEDREVKFEGFKNLVEDYITQVKSKLSSDALADLEKKGYERSLLEEAVEKRFEETKLSRLRRDVPILLAESERAEYNDPDWDNRDDAVPLWVTLTHLLFMGWTILNAHHSILFVLGFLFFLGFSQTTKQYQNRISLKPAMLVGFFLAGLVIHGGLQAWWIQPVLGNLNEVMLMISATVLTAVNDNAAITYLSTLVPGFTDGLKYAVVAGAIAGGGLTVIANAPNPAGQALLKSHFNGSVSPLGLLKAAILPTLIVWICLVLL